MNDVNHEGFIEYQFYISTMSKAKNMEFKTVQDLNVLLIDFTGCTKQHPHSTVKY